MADAVSQIVQPMYHGVAFDSVKYHIPARWIWHEEQEFDRTVLPKPGVRYLRKTFKISAWDKAELLVTADHEYKLYLNGESLIQGSDVRVYVPQDVGGKLVAGINCLAAEVTNEGVLPNPAGMLLHLRLIKGKDTTHICSDGSWKSWGETPSSDWKETAFNGHQSPPSLPSQPASSWPKANLLLPTAHFLPSCPPLHEPARNRRT